MNIFTFVVHHYMTLNNESQKYNKEEEDLTTFCIKGFSEIWEK